MVLIPARGGSKGVPKKNIKLLNGKPLIQYTIEAARGIFNDTHICVSTDDEEIKSIVENLGLFVPFLRPQHLASDLAGTYEVLLHAIRFYENIGYFPDTLILLQPTSPFRSTNHIREALALYDSFCEMVVSVKETKSNPYFILREENEQGWLVKLKDGIFITRQSCPKVYEMNGAIYIINIEALKSKPIHELMRVRKYEMDEISSHDIDSELDWKFSEMMFQI